MGGQYALNGAPFPQHEPARRARKRKIRFLGYDPAPEKQLILKTAVA
jgi:hypothetical protein